MQLNFQEIPNNSIIDVDQLGLMFQDTGMPIDVAIFHEIEEDNAICSVNGKFFAVSPNKIVEFIRTID
jgi:hypothetical protein